MLRFEVSVGGEVGIRLRVAGHFSAVGGPNHFGTSPSRGQGNVHVGSLMAHADILHAALYQDTERTLLPLSER